MTAKMKLNNPKNPLVSIVILNYNTRDLLRQTLSSIDSKVPFEVIVVDNASSDGSVGMVKKEFPHVKLIEAKSNDGFAAGNNQGVRSARGENIMLLNSDTQFVGDSLSPLVQYFDQKPLVGVVTPKLITPDGRIDWSCHRGFPTIWNSLTYFSKIYKFFPSWSRLGGYHQTWKNLSKAHEVDVVSGAAMLIKREVWDQVGSLDERFFMYAEDIDYCLRVKQAGWQIHYQPEAKVIHHKGLSGTKNKNQKVKSKTKHYFYETMKQYWDKHYSQAYPGFVTSLVHSGVDLVERVRK